ncbi:MAG TPA: T9SS type A sorting domain-containing protein [Bacteroidia bacterium]|nr:T9SS type A sorting domain-containing protein [Bacteroidia bacterium]
MKINVLRMLSVFAVAAAFFLTAPANAQPCSDAGTPSTTEDSICVGGSTNLLLTAYIGNIQWQSYNGTNWIDETGPGATTDNYLVTPAATIDYRAVVTASGCDPDTSTILTIVVGVTAPTTIGDTRCGYGPVSLTAAGSGIRWYDVPTGGTPVGFGTNLVTNVNNTTTFYASASSNGGGSGTTPMPAEVTTFAGNARGYFFTAPSDFNITGLFVPGPNTGNQNIAVIRFDNQIPPPVFAATTNAFSTLFLTQNNPATGVIPVNISIAAGDVIGVLATRGADVNSYANGPATTTIDGQSVTIARMGMQFPLATIAPQDIWQEVGGSISRLEITYEVGCESSRTPAVATVNPPVPVTITSVPPALCLGQSATITASSSNTGYNYTWSPSAGLNTTTGATVTYTPVGTGSTYITLVGDDGVCGYIDSIQIVTGSPSVAGTAIISSDTVCLGDNASLFLTGSTGSIQWQSFNGTNWVNETGPGNTTAQYQVTPTTFSTFRAVVTSGGCDPDTSIELSVEVLAITDPLVTGDTICGPGTANLTATGAGIMSWYTTPTGGLNVFQGSTYSPSLTNTTTYYVEAAAGGTYHVGAPDLSIGTFFTLPGNDWGIQFDALAQCTLERVYVSPGPTSGNITINLRSSQGGPILNTVTVPVTASSGLVPVTLGFTVNPGQGYRLELAAGSTPCYYNSFGAAYPYSVPNGPITLTGQINPNYSAGTFYYFFYDWVVTEGCKSNRIPVTGAVLPLPPTPTIAPQWNTLTSSSPTGNQWYLNGNPIPGATGQVYVATQSGTYTVVVTGANGCTATSQQVFTTGIQELLSQNGFAVYPNPVADKLTIELASPVKDRAVVNIYNVLGGLVKTIVIHQSKNDLDFNLPAGTYSIEIRANDSVYRTKVLKM